MPKSRHIPAKNPLIPIANQPSVYCLPEEKEQLRQIYTICEMAVLLRVRMGTVARWFSPSRPGPMLWAHYAYLLMASIDALPPEIGRPPAYAKHSRFSERQKRAILATAERDVRKAAAGARRQAKIDAERAASRERAEAARADRDAKRAASQPDTPRASKRGR